MTPPLLKCTRKWRLERACMTTALKSLSGEVSEPESDQDRLEFEATCVCVCVYMYISQFEMTVNVGGKDLSRTSGQRCRDESKKPIGKWPDTQQNLLCTRLLQTITPSTSGVEGARQILRYDGVRGLVLSVNWEPGTLPTVKFSHRKLALHLNKCLDKINISRMQWLCE